MSLITRLLGFGLCLVGAFTAAYFRSVHLTANMVDGIVNLYAGSTPQFNAAILSQVATYFQQNVPSDWETYSVIGIAMAIAGSVIVAVGDRKPVTLEK